MPLSRNSKSNLEKSSPELQNAQSFFTGDYEYLITENNEKENNNKAHNQERNLRNNIK
ncbi:hypothetical protein SDC9_121183 [bioreactor metagenome]|uniref:Uncharacterized protein n=1 Tax=bioreactor metagenome TaxID=1076179 RepID=A0A645CBC2_9ZZZZ